MKGVEVRALAGALLVLMFLSCLPFCLGPASCLPLACWTVRKWTLSPAQTPATQVGTQGRPAIFPRFAQASCFRQAKAPSLPPLLGPVAQVAPKQIPLSGSAFPSPGSPSLWWFQNGRALAALWPPEGWWG